MIITGIFGFFNDLDYWVVVSSLKYLFSQLLGLELLPCVGYESRPQCTGSCPVNKPHVIAARPVSRSLVSSWGVVLSRDLSESLPTSGVFHYSICFCFIIFHASSYSLLIFLNLQPPTLASDIFVELVPDRTHGL